MQLGDILYSETETCKDTQCARPATRFVIATLQGPVDFQVCMNCDTRECPNPRCDNWLLDPFAQTCPHCGADVSLTAPE